MTAGRRRLLEGASAAVIAASAVVFALAAWRSARFLNTLWDEPIDLDIARGLLADPLRGEQPPLDASQMRLPMYATALALRLTGRETLETARAVSVGVGAATILVSGALAWRLFGPTAAGLTALLLGLSPYFIAFGRVAMTEGDVFLSLLVTATCLAFIEFVRKPTGPRWAAAGVCFGLALGAKAHAILLAPVFAAALLARRNSVWPGPATDRRQFRALSAWLALTGAALALTAGLAAAGSRAAGAALVLVWAGVVGSIAAAWRRDLRAYGRAASWGGLVVLAAGVCGGLMPVHLLQPAILRELARRTLLWDHQIPLALWDDHLRLYAGILLLKTTIPIGVLTMLALVHAAFAETTDRRWRLPILTTLVWTSALCFLPLRQTFYLMGVFPLLMLLTAGFMTHLAGRIGQRGGVRRWAAWLACVVAPVALLGVQSVCAFPDYHLFGHELIGNRWMGAESRGYRNLVQTNSDGVEDLVDWCVRNVAPGQRVVSYLWEDHIIARWLPDRIQFTIVGRGVSLESGELPPPPSIDEADYVLLHVNNLVGYGDRAADTPPLSVLRRDFAPVFTVRGGVDGMAIGWVYGRRVARSGPAAGGGGGGRIGSAYEPGAPGGKRKKP